MANGSKPATRPANAISTVFRELTREIHRAVRSQRHESAVDLEITFQSVSVDSKGIPLFTKKQKESTMQVRLATRIHPESPAPDDGS